MDGDTEPMTEQSFSSLTTEVMENMEVNPKKRGGVPVLKGTRIKVSRILAEIADGRNINEIADSFEVDRILIKDLIEGLALAFDRRF